MNVKTAGTGLSNIPTNQNDALSSWINNSTRRGAWYQHANGGGACHTMGTRSYATYNWLDGTNDTMSSWRMNGGC